MNYLSFLIKKTCKKRLNIMPYGLVIVFILFFYAFSNSVAFGLISVSEDSEKKGLEQIETEINYFQDQLDYYEKGSEEYNVAESNYNIANLRKGLIQQNTDAIKNGNWHEFYESEFELSSLKLKVFNNDIGLYGQDVIDVVKLDQKYYQFMMDNNLSFDDRYLSIQGISHMVKSLNDYLPFLLPILLIFLVSSMYCSSYKDKMNIHQLLPMSRLKKQESRLLSGCVMGLFSVFFISLIAILCGTIGNTFGSLNTPVLMYTIDGADIYVKFISILLPFVVLLILSILFIINLVSVISLFIRRNMTCLFVSLVLVLGCLFVSLNLAPAQPYLHLIPTTYLNSLQVITGELMSSTQNMNITFMYGVIVLTITNVILFIIYYYVPSILAKRGSRIWLSM